MIMKKILMLAVFLGMTMGIAAQPEARRQAQQKAKQSNANSMTTRAQIMFPTSASMGEDVVWRRDIYRELDLNDDANAALYYPVEAVGGQMNLFTYMFKLMLSGKVRAYQYRLDGHESFNYDDRVVPKAFMDNYHIFYERNKNGALTLDDSDIPSREVKSYYIKEAAYYDQRTATFHTKVIALCPIMTRDDDFGDAGTKYPLFWMKYDDLAPYLAKQQIMTSNLNNAATMSIDDYFVRNQYKGKIYKTTNMLGKTLAQYCPNDSALSKEQKRIEGELAAFEKNIWGDQAKKDSLDSIANADKKNVKGVKKNRRGKSSSGSSVRNRRQRNSGSSNGTSAARVSVRRERH